MRTLILVSLAAGLLAGAAGAETIVGGSITMDTIWGASGSPYIVTDDVTVNENVTLTIQPGVTVAFDGFWHLNADWDGTILAIGDPGNHVLFTSNHPDPENNHWEYVQVLGDSGSAFTYCTFEYAYMGVRANNSSPDIDHCLFRLCTTGIFCAMGSPTIEHCDITANRDGIWISNNPSQPVIHYNNIHQNTHWNIYSTTYPAPEVVVDAENNWWGTTDPVAIANEINDSTDMGGIYVTIDFDPWLGEMPTEPMSWGGVKTIYGQ